MAQHLEVAAEVRNLLSNNLISAERGISYAALTNMGLKQVKAVRDASNRQQSCDKPLEVQCLHYLEQSLVTPTQQPVWSDHNAGEFHLTDVCALPAGHRLRGSLHSIIAGVNNQNARTAQRLPDWYSAGSRQNYEKVSPRSVNHVALLAIEAVRTVLSLFRSSTDMPKVRPRSGLAYRECTDPHSPPGSRQIAEPLLGSAKQLHI